MRSLRHIKTPKWVNREHLHHVRTFQKPVPGNIPSVKGHALRMVAITKISYECECGKKLRKPK